MCFDTTHGEAQLTASNNCAEVEAKVSAGSGRGRRVKIGKASAEDETRCLESNSSANIKNIALRRAQNIPTHTRTDIKA